MGSWRLHHESQSGNQGIVEVRGGKRPGGKRRTFTGAWMEEYIASDRGGRR